ncbi:c-type cytochrome [Marivirga arenosa]|uniref:Cytochrome c n=1 Tax=Marivirga arenosa TaxID=3059076 RepID=A0AA51ZXG5_9BACT|nr:MULTISPECIES: cytochrome c [unclassified Marivirga]WKK87479.1 cytochrome c [Marivirga sp. ABR2-2]WNB18505.1 cytochrome c [Marivirga sp. BKB1-2]
MMNTNKIFQIIFLGFVTVVLVSCKAGKDEPGLEYAPNMYHAVSYEPLTQITDKEQGAWVSSDDDEYGEYFNSNPNNPFGMTMREPVSNTVPRSENGMLPYRLHKDSLDLAARILENPLPNNEAVVAEGKVLYTKYCTHCHGENGGGSMDETAKVGQVYQGVPAYNTGRVATVSGGHIFHVITHGKGRMGAHGSQVLQEDRWKIVRYVQTLQKQD